MTSLHRAPGAVVAMFLLAVIVRGSHAPLTTHRGNDGVVRLAWSARPERTEQCRERSADELARLPQHMRQPIICEGTSARYRLTVRSEDRVVAERLVHGGGLRQDRMLYVFQEVRVDPGEASIDVRFDRLDSEPPRRPSAGADLPPVASGRGAWPQPAGEAVPAHLRFAERLRVRPREVILVTYSPQRRALVAVRGSTHEVQ